MVRRINKEITEFEHDGGMRNANLRLLHYDIIFPMSENNISL